MTKQHKGNSPPQKQDFYSESEGEKEIPYYKEKNRKMNEYLDKKRESGRWEERFDKEFPYLGCIMEDDGRTYTFDDIKSFISTELQKQYHDYEILVNTILETKNKEIQEAERRAYVKGYCDARNRYKERERLIKLLKK